MLPFQPDFDETIAAFAAGRRADGMAACERLLQRTDLPRNYRAATQRNQVHYARALVDLAPSFWARRIVCEVHEGDLVAIGDTYGLIRYGSRLDTYLPAGSEVVIELGQRTLAGETVLARLP